MNNIKTVRVFTWIVLAVVLAFAGFQLYNYFYGGYRTETAYTYEVSNSVLTRGVLLRDEQPLSLNPDGVVVYAVQEGGKIRGGTVLARTYSSAEDAARAAERQRYSEELAALEEISGNIGAASVHEVQSIGNGILNTIRGISRDVRYGKLDALEESRLTLEGYLNRRDRITGSGEAIEARIAELKTLIGDAVPCGTVTSNAAGYFSRYVDGREGELTPALIETADSAAIAALAAADYPYEYSAFGKAVSDYAWYYATVVSREDAALFREGGNAKLTFVGSAGGAVSAKVYKITEEPANDCAILYFTGETVNADTISRRSASVLISTDTGKGVRFPQKALRIVDGVKGVYVDQGYSVAFKKVDIIYTGKDFYISRANALTNDFLGNFDEIIVGGTELYDGKPLRS